MDTQCIEVQEFKDIENELRETLEKLGSDLIGDRLLWI